MFLGLVPTSDTGIVVTTVFYFYLHNDKRTYAGGLCHNLKNMVEHFLMIVLSVIRPFIKFFKACGMDPKNLNVDC